MSKTLDFKLSILKNAQKGIERISKIDIAEEFGHGSLSRSIPYGDDYDDIKKALKLLEQALTPPTADEVCDEISKYYKKMMPHLSDFNVKYKEKNYNSNKYIFISYVDKITEFGNYVCQLNPQKSIIFDQPLPPYLVILIGRFYEGLENANDNT